MKRSPRLTQGFTRTLNPKLEGFIRVHPTAVELIGKKPSLGPQNGKWLERASFMSIVAVDHKHNPLRIARVNPNPNQARRSSLAFTRYCFTSRLMCTNQSSFIASLHPHCPHYCNMIARLLGSIRLPLRTLVCLLIHLTILVIPISCKAQALAQTRPPPCEFGLRLIIHKNVFGRILALSLQYRGGARYPNADSPVGQVRHIGIVLING